MTSEAWTGDYVRILTGIGKKDTELTICKCSQL